MGSINGTTTVVLSPYFTQERDSKNFSLQHELCLPGYMFNDETKKCECTETEEVILCQDNLAGLVLAVSVQNSVAKAVKQFSVWFIDPMCLGHLLTYRTPSILNTLSTFYSYRATTV